MLILQELIFPSVKQGKEVDITKLNSDVLIVDDIPDEPEKEGEENCPEHEFQTNN